MIEEAHTVYVSAVSHVEIQIKAMTGKLRLPDQFAVAVAQAGLASLPLIDRHAWALKEFPELAGHDPFDRQVVAQAQAEGLDLLTADRTLLRLQRPWIYDSRL